MPETKKPDLVDIEISYHGKTAELARLAIFVGQGLQKFLIPGSARQALQDRFGGCGWIQACAVRRSSDHLIIHAPHQPDARGNIWPEEQLLTASRRALDINSRENAPLLQAARKVQLHVARAFELLIHHVIHARASVDQAG